MKKALIVVGITTLVLTGCNQPASQTDQKKMETQQDSKQTQNEMAQSMPAMQMKPETPPALTETQSAQLKMGQEAHSPQTLTFNIVGGNFYYVPNEIHVKKGDTVKIVFENAGGFHNFVLDEFNVKIDPINGGQTATAEFVADKAGTFEYYCGVGRHRQMGQKGTLIVEE